MPSGLLRPLAAALAVGAAAGLVAAGGGSRIAMRLIAVADGREDFGLQTDAGATVGEVTFDGTVGVLITGTMLGIGGALLYVAIRRWLPIKPLFRTLVFAALVLGFGLGQVVRGNEGDFVFVDTVVSLVSFGVVFVLCGLAVPPLVDRLAPPPTGGSRWGGAFTAAALVAAVAFAALGIDHAFDLAAVAFVPST